MIVARSPLRISLGGGGTDLPSYYRKRGGLVVAAAIDKHVYITIHRTFIDEMIVKYSSIERVRKVEDIRHPILREAIKLSGLPELNVEITSMADIPAGTGLGSSGSFTTALLKALHAYQGRRLAPAELAEQACKVELDLLKEPIGKQDQYVAAFGGLNVYRYNPDGSVSVSPLKAAPDALKRLEQGLTLYFTGYARDASKLLKDQDDRSRADDDAMLSGLDRIKEYGLQIQAALESGNLKDFAALMNEHWERKRVRTGGMSNERIDAWYKLARQNGALGGKLVGAGGGGFLMFYSEDRARLSRAMAGAGLPEVPVRFDMDGAKLVDL